MKYNRGFANIILVIVGFILVGVLFGYFKKNKFFFQPIMFGENTVENSNTTTSQKEFKCGLAILEPNLQAGPLMFPVSVTGYVNGCGWNVYNGSAGSVQVYDGNGVPVSNNIPLILTPESNQGNSNFPSVFMSTLALTRNPTLNQGFIVFEAVQTGKLTAGSFKMPIIFAPNYAF